MDLQFAVIIKHVSLCLVPTEKQKSAPAKQNAAVNSSSRNHSATVIALCPRPHGSLAAGWRSSGRAPHAPPCASRRAQGLCARGRPRTLLPVRCLAPPTVGWLFPCVGGAVPHAHALVLVTFVTVIGFSARHIKSVFRGCFLSLTDGLCVIMCLTCKQNFDFPSNAGRGENTRQV